MRWLVFLLFTVSLSSCLVTKKKFDAQKALADRCDSTLADCSDKLKKAEADLSLLKGSESDLRSKLEKENAENESLNAKYTKLNGDFEQSQKQYEDLKARMEALGKNSMSEKESLSSALKQKEKDLAEREKRIHELESLIAKKDEAVSSLKKKIADALIGFNSNELTVTQRDGKVYVSLSDKLLFKSGSFTVDEKGKQAIVKVAEVLNKQTEIGIVIEGHTDSKQYVNPKGEIKNNWDLSVMRAAMVTSIMITDGKVEASRITPSGHAEFFPVESNETPEGRSKNRRIEIVLSPDLKEIFKILDNTNP